MDKKEVARVLEEIALLLELRGENPFKSRAYENGARLIETLEDDLERLVRDNRLSEIQGIGKGLADKISELVTTGELGYYEGLKAEIPPGLLEMVRIPGFGPKRTRAVYEALGIASIGELEYACVENRLVDLKGFGKKSQEKVLGGIQFLKRARGRFLLSEASRCAEQVVAAIRETPGIIRASICGSLRRRCETVKDIDILVASDEPAPIMDALVSLDRVEGVIAQGRTKSSVRLASGIQVDLRVVADVQFPAALHYFTGSKAHNIALRARAQRVGLKLNEYGLFDGDRALPLDSEDAIFERLGLQPVPPELREDAGEIAAAESGELPRLVDRSDLQGLFHNHSTWSDGSDTIEQLARAAGEAGYRYIGLSDHSQTAVYANGLTAARVEEQQREIDRLNETLSGITILKGIESDILPDGSLDYPEAVLKSFDFVVAAVHSGLGASKEEMTRRIVKAVENPHTTILGHPTGRLLLARDPYPVDLDEVIKVCARNDVAIELNANPHRLDIDWRHCRIAREAGCRIAINPDAHSVEGLDDMEYGVGTARRGWIGPDMVLNAMKLESLQARGLVCA